MTTLPAPPTPHSRLPHRMATLLVCATFPLIWVGGLVTTTEAGMAVPDWPNTFGYNLLLYPWTTWLAGPWDVFVEHGHRLFAVLVGLLTIGFVWTVWKRDPRRRMRVSAVVALAGVVSQGVLGGMRVLFDERLLAMTHACVGPLFFAYCTALWHFTSRRSTESQAAADDVSAAKLYRLSVITTALAYVQLTFGAVVRHMPVYAPPSSFRAAVLLHLAMAAVLTIHVTLVCFRALSRRDAASRSAGLSRPAWLLAASIVAQLCLGAATWVVNYGYPQWVGRIVEAPAFVVRTNSLPQVLVTTAHVAVGSLILATTLTLALRARLLTARNSTAAALVFGGLLQEAAV